MKKILTINPGSTSTKLAIFNDDTEVARKELMHSVEEITASPLMIDQLEFRSKAVKDFLDESGIDIDSFDMISCRGCSANGLNTGAYKVDEHVLTIVRHAARSQHASSLAILIASELVKDHPNVPLMFYDAPASTDASDKIRFTGRPEYKRTAADHALNSKIVAREVAESIGKPYEQCNIIVAHLGGGITFSLHSGGKIVDVVEDDAGPMSPARAGRMPSNSLVSACYSGKYTRPQMTQYLRGKAGLVAYLGTQDAREVEKMIADGNQKAHDLYWYMSYQIAKAIGELYVAAHGKVDRIAITGGMAHSKLLTGWIEEQVSFLAPVVIIPGEREMLALARGALRVLSGEEQLQEYRWLPIDCYSLEEVREKYPLGSMADDYWLDDKPAKPE